jgi:hypothetical protein
LAVAVQQTQMALQTQAVALEELMVDKQPLAAQELLLSATHPHHSVAPAVQLHPTQTLA